MSSSIRFHSEVGFGAGSSSTFRRFELFSGEVNRFAQIFRIFVETSVEVKLIGLVG